MIVTTSLRCLGDDVTIARSIAAQIDGTYVPREKDKLSDLQIKHVSNQFIVVENRKPVVYQGEERFFFHRGMAELRILNLIRSGNDPMVAAMELRQGMSVLDCTLGLAADALVSSFAVGPSGQVVGLEVSPIIAALTQRGLSELCDLRSDARPETKQAARHIKVICSEHETFLAQIPDSAYDVVYFDPMFRRPKQSSFGIQPLRNFADSRPLGIETIRQARRVARNRVVIKEAHGSPEFSRLGIRHFGGGRYSPVQYGILGREDTE